jgi:hypothetical protein
MLNMLEKSSVHTMQQMNSETASSLLVAPIWVFIKPGPQEAGKTAQRSE